MLNGKPALQFEEPSDDARPDEDSKMEMDDEAVRSNQFDVRKKRSRMTRKRCLDEGIKNAQKNNWQREMAQYYY